MSGREVVEGAGLLQAFLQTNKLSQAAAGEGIGVSDVTVHDWVHGYKRPRSHHRDAIEIWTSGSVPTASWETATERALRAGVRPHEAPSSTPALPASDDDAA